MRHAVWPAHAAARRARGEMGPLHMPEIFVVERLRQSHPVILEGMDRAMLAVEKRARIGDLGKRVADQPAGAERRGNRVFWKIDRAFFVEVNCREIQQRMAVDRVVQPRLP